MQSRDKAQWVIAKAKELGWNLCGVAQPEDCVDQEHRQEWLARGYAGDMRYLHDERRAEIVSVLPEARAVIVCGISYNAAKPYSTEAAAQAAFAGGAKGWISRYAWGDDYHRVLGEKLESLIAAMREEFGADFSARAYVDTGPISERVVAQKAGLGWLAKNTCLINQEIGSFFFLGVIVTSLDLLGNSDSFEEIETQGSGAKAPAEDAVLTSRLKPRPTNLEQFPLGGLASARSSRDEKGPLSTRTVATGSMDAAKGVSIPPMDLCGNCSLCIDACPTGALVEPYVMDARRCISYLTIEYRGSIPDEFRSQMGWQVFGCDICQDVCPWNRNAPQTSETRFAPRENSVAPELECLLSLTEDDFRRSFKGSPVKRAKWRGLIRNACIAAGNALARGQRVPYDASPAPGPDVLARLRERLTILAASDDALIAEHAQWALKQRRDSSTPWPRVANSGAIEKAPPLRLPRQVTSE